MAQPTVATLALSLYRGEDYVAVGTHRSSRVPDSDPVDISGWSIKATIKEDADDEDPVLEVTATLSSPTSGVYALSIAAADTADLEARDYAIDVWRINSGAKTALGKGTLTVKQPVRTPV